MGWLASLTLEDEVRQDLDLPPVVCKYEDVFQDELPRLPPHKDVNFVIELHPSTSPISMTPKGPDTGTVRHEFHYTEHFTMGHSGYVCKEEG